MKELVDISDSVFYVCVDSNLKVIDYNNFFKHSFLHIDNLHDIVNPDDMKKLKSSLKGKNASIRLKRGFNYECVRVCVDKVHFNHYHILGVFQNDTPQQTRHELRRLTKMLEDLQIDFNHRYVRHLANIEGGIAIIEGCEVSESIQVGVNIAKAAALALREALGDGVQKYKL